MRGTTTASWQIGVLAVLSVVFIGLSWLLLRRAMRRV
jgi:hypothetical protein